MEAGLMRKLLVVSAVNFTEGGPLTVLRDCLDSAAQILPPEWEIIALVHRYGLVDNPRVRVIPIPSAKRSWLARIYYEWHGFSRLSKEWSPDCWLSLHDVTPRVAARRQAVYCHNPAPFYRLSLREAYLEPKFWLFNWFYRYLYRAFIRRNAWIIVQQDWLREEFKSFLGALPLLVAYPSMHISNQSSLAMSLDSTFVFLYPALPRVFKNFEVVCEAAKILAHRGLAGFEVRLTLSGVENRYAKYLYASYARIPGVKFIGRQNRIEMSDQYRRASVVIFPSKLETWGLPISEAMAYGKPMLVADLRYAHETVGDYAQVSFFHPTDPIALANLMEAILRKSWHPEGASRKDPCAPFTRGWAEFWELLTLGL
jgi:glycosyltransferase involved in cell wall biosynthesis